MTDFSQPETISKKLMAFNIVLFVTVVFLVFLIYSALHRSRAVEDVIPGHIVSTHVFDQISLDAKAAYVYDMSDKTVLFQKNAEAQLPLASLTKLMTALVATESAPSYLHVAVRKEFLTGEDSRPLSAKEEWRLSDLIDLSLVASSNDAAVSIASVIGSQSSNMTDFDIGQKEFVSKMNDRAASLNLNQTYFLNPSGLDESSKTAGAYGSASDVAKLISYMIKNHPEILEATKYPQTKISSLSKEHLIKNTDTALDKIPNIIASKTGFTELAGGNLAIVFDASIGHPVIVVVLGSTQEGRFSDVVNLVNKSVEYFQQEK